MAEVESVTHGEFADVVDLGTINQKIDEIRELIEGANIRATHGPEQKS
jgi:DNA polymerase III gamma/tau subunit